jgi:raffinose/stachyose/melibiose transport system substrate-binding protein
VDPKTTSRRSILGLGLGAPLAGAALAACGGSGPTRTGAGGGGGSGGGGGGGGAGGATYWFLTGQPQQAVREDTVKRFNSSNSGGQIAYTEFQNDAYKTKIKTAIGAGQGPTIIWGWGGGGLREYVKNNQVVDLSPWFDQNPQQKSRRFKSSFTAATVDGKIYALPAEVVTPIVFYYNKKVFDKAGVSEPIFEYLEVLYNRQR